MSFWSTVRALLATTVLASASGLAFSPAQADSGRIQFTVITLIVLLLSWFAYALTETVNKIPDPIGRLFGINGDIPEPAWRAYEIAAQDAPDGCNMTPSQIAGFAKVESGNGQYGGATVGADGVVSPAIRGVRLDGSLEGTAVIYDTDDGLLDGDAEFDRAVGPAQALPESWSAFMPPGSDPQNIEDAARFIVAYTCRYGDLSQPAAMRQAVLAYNHSESYADDVIGWQSAYQQASYSFSAPPAPKGETSPFAVMRAQAWNVVGRHAPPPLRPAAQYLLEPKKPGPGTRGGATSGQGDRIAAAARTWVGREYNPGMAAQCMYWTRQVLEDAGMSVGVTSEPLDGEWTGEGIANSIGGDQGQVIKDPQLLQPGDVVMFTQTYGNWGPHAITHVGIYVGDGQIVDRSTLSQPVKQRPLTTFEHFAGGVRLWPGGREVV